MRTLEESARTASAQWLVDRLDGHSAREIGDGIEKLIRTKELAGGQQLPTIREIAKAADVSPGTVLIAWNHLREAGLINTHRRGGTIVVDSRGTARTPAALPAWSTIDFLQCAPDVALQPDLREALLDSLSDVSLNVFGREYMTERLRSAVEPTWPFAAQSWTTAGGGTEALLLAVAAAAEPGSSVAVDEPASPGLLDTLRDLSLTPIGVAADDKGPCPESLAAAIGAGAVAFVFQPGAEFAMNHQVSQERADELAAVIADSDQPVWVIEDDAIGPLAVEQSPTMGHALPGQVVRVRSYCKAYGIDVRTSVIGGSRELVERSISLRSHGVGSNSRILQNTLAHLIKSREAEEVVIRARESYHRRRDLLADALAARGVKAWSGTKSLVLWVEVADETDALVSLAGRGISVAPGSKVFVAQPSHAVVRISPLQLPDDEAAVLEFAKIVTTAAAGAAREFFD